MSSNPHDGLSPGIVRVPVVFVNAYLVDVTPGEPRAGFVLVDSGLGGIGALEIQRAAAARYGSAARPRAIVLTHGHFDHAGSAAALAARWGVPVYVHALELPYVTGRSLYPPADPTVGGALAMLSRTFARGGSDLRGCVTRAAGRWHCAAASRLASHPHARPHRRPCLLLERGGWSPVGGGRTRDDEPGVLDDHRHDAA